MKAGQYFGERALLANNSKRAATARACGRVVALVLSQATLARALGADLQVRKG